MTIPGLQLLVDGLFQELLGRLPVGSELPFWEGVLGNSAQVNTATLANVATAIANSNEYKTDLIVSFFQRFLGRTPSIVEQGALLSAGFTPQQLEANILGSPEFFSRVGSSNAAYISALYHDVLGRAPGAGDAAFVTALFNALQGGAITRVQAAFDIVNSQESYAQLLEFSGSPNPYGLPVGWFEHFLGIVPGSSLQTTIFAFANLLMNGGNGVPFPSGMTEAQAIGTLFADFYPVGTDLSMSYTAVGAQTVTNFEVPTGFTLQIGSGSAATGTIVDGSGTLTIESSGTATTTDVSGTMTVQSGGSATDTTIESTGTLDVQSGATVGGTIAFSGVGGTLKIDGTSLTVAPGLLLNGATISGFAAGDKIDLTGIAYDATGHVNLLSGNLLEISENGHVYDLQLSPTQDFTGDLFHLNPDSGAGTAISEDHIACYCRGTLIRTAHGDAPVENLSIGDRVMTISGEAKPIKWIGRRSYPGRFVAGNASVLPVMIRAGALEENTPARDLWISPEHALHIGGYLIPARNLVNGVSISQAERVETLEYFHVELEDHDVIFAEGAAAETYFDDDNRRQFQNWEEFATLYANGVAHKRRFRALRLNEGDERCQRIQARLAVRAGLPMEAPCAALPENRVANPPMKGAVPGLVGVDGALPANWLLYDPHGLTFSVTGSGEDDGIPYTEIRIAGRPVDSTQKTQLLFGESGPLVAAPGERWLIAAHVKKVAGSGANLQTIEVGANLCLEDGGWSSWLGSAPFAQEDVSFAEARAAFTQRISDPRCAHVRPLLQLTWTNREPIDITLRVGGVFAGVSGLAEIRNIGKAA